MRILIGVAAAVAFGGSGVVALFDLGGIVSRFRGAEAAWWSGSLLRKLHPGTERLRGADRVIGVVLILVGVFLLLGTLFANSG